MTTPVRHRSAPLRVAVIVGSIREGRAGAAITDWFVAQAEPRDDLDLDVLDLAELALPVVFPDDEARIPTSVTAAGHRLDAADAIVVVTPEYNHSFPASLKNAVDWFHAEWFAKPIAFVSYGGRAEGVRAVEQLRQVFVEVHAMTTRDGVSINVDTVDERGWPASDGVEGAAKLMLDELAWWGRALRDARAREPYLAV
jgi:NAD(P)H-dependent FMN reductase